MASDMYFSDSDWAVITSHHKWSFLRRLHDPPMLLYSQIELQEDNTRPFRALVAMILAAKGLITIPPPPDDLISVAHDYHAVAQQEGSGPNPGSSQTHESHSEDESSRSQDTGSEYTPDSNSSSGNKSNSMALAIQPGGDTVPNLDKKLKSRGDLEVCSFSSFLTLQLSVRTDSIT